MSLLPLARARAIGVPARRKPLHKTLRATGATFAAGQNRALHPRPQEANAMQEQSTDRHPLSNLEYDWITLMQNKAQALVAYDQYIKDAERANSPECAAFFRKVHDADKAQLAEARKHLLAVMQGSMGGNTTGSAGSAGST